MSLDPLRPRPVFLQPLRIELPVMATVSFAHRVSGVMLALLLPFLVHLLSLSLRDAAGFEKILARMHSPTAVLVLLVLAWGLTHHTAAGIRHMLFDAGIGTSLGAARRSAWGVHALALAVTALVAGALR
jgi:succinate dehydrogenase / fumarate reductase cytochrome b subunit